MILLPIASLMTGLPPILVFACIAQQEPMSRSMRIGILSDDIALWVDPEREARRRTRIDEGYELVMAEGISLGYSLRSMSFRVDRATSSSAWLSAAISISMKRPSEKARALQRSVSPEG